MANNSSSSGVHGPLFSPTLLQHGVLLPLLFLVVVVVVVAVAVPGFLMFSFYYFDLSFFFLFLFLFCLLCRLSLLVWVRKFAEIACFCLGVMMGLVVALLFWDTN